MEYVDWKETLVFNSSIGTGQGTLINIGICKFSTEGFIGSQVSTTVRTRKLWNRKTTLNQYWSVFLCNYKANSFTGNLFNYL